jgi:hypothetical protein
MTWDDALVFTTGKVGSTTLEKSLLRYFPSVFKVHSLTSNGIHEYETFKGRGFIARRERLAVKRIQEKNDPIIIFTISRDPIAAVVSSVFHNNNIYFSALGNQTYNQIRDKIVSSTRTWDYFLNWYFREFEAVTNFDLLSEELNWKNGAMIFEIGRITIVVFRLENLTEWFQPAMSKLLGNGLFDLISHNRAFSKNYADLYKGFCAQVSFPKEFVDWVYTSRYARAFYNQSELDMFSRTWCKQHLITKV